MSIIWFRGSRTPGREADAQGKVTSARRSFTSILPRGSGEPGPQIIQQGPEAALLIGNDRGRESGGQVLERALGPVRIGLLDGPEGGDVLGHEPLPVRRGLVRLHEVGVP